MRTVIILLAVCSLAAAQGQAGELVDGQTQQIAVAPAPASSSTSGKGAFTDSRNGRRYRTVKMGGKTWMAENLNYNVGHSWCYGNKSKNCQKYGRLYDWNAAMSACPEGWRLPTRQDWNDLVQAAGGNVAGTKFKSKIGWNYNGNGTDEFGFSALPGGRRYAYGSFLYVDSNSYWWSATEEGGGNAWYWYMSSSYAGVYENHLVKSGGFSVRCVQD